MIARQPVLKTSAEIDRSGLRSAAALFVILLAGSSLTAQNPTRRQEPQEATKLNPLGALQTTAKNIILSAVNDGLTIDFEKLRTYQNIAAFKQSPGALKEVVPDLSTLERHMQGVHTSQRTLVLNFITMEIARYGFSGEGTKSIDHFQNFLSGRAVSLSSPTSTIPDANVVQILQQPPAPTSITNTANNNLPGGSDPTPAETATSTATAIPASKTPVLNVNKEKEPILNVIERKLVGHSRPSDPSWLEILSGYPLLGLAVVAVLAWRLLGRRRAPKKL